MALVQEGMAVFEINTAARVLAITDMGTGMNNCEFSFQE